MFWASKRFRLSSYLLMLRSNALFSRLPRRAPEYLSGTARSTQGHKGRGRDAARRQRGRKPLLPSPDKCDERKT